MIKKKTICYKSTNKEDIIFFDRCHSILTPIIKKKNFFPLQKLYCNSPNSHKTKEQMTLPKRKGYVIKKSVLKQVIAEENRYNSNDQAGGDGVLIKEQSMSVHFLKTKRRNRTLANSKKN